MRKFGYSFLVFILAVVLTIPSSLVAIDSVFAEDEGLINGRYVKDKNNKNVEAKDKTFWNDHETEEWGLQWNSDVVLEVWYDLKWGDDGSDPGETPKELTVKLQKKNGKDFKDTNQKVKIKSLGREKKQVVKFKGLEKGETYRLLFDGKALTWHRVSYKLFYDNPIKKNYKLKTAYDYVRDGNDVLKYSIVKEDQDGNVHFNGKVKYEITPANGNKVTETKNVNSSKSKTFKIDKFVDNYLPPETENSDSEPSVTKVKVTYEGTVDSVDQNNRYYRLQRETRIYRYTRELELKTKKENGKITVTARALLGDAAKDGKWEIALMKGNEKLASKKPEDNKDKKVTVSFSYKDFKDNKSATVRAVYTGKKVDTGERDLVSLFDSVVLYRHTAKKNVDAPSKPKDDQDKPKDDKDKPKDDKDKPKDDKDKPKEDQDKPNEDKPKEDNDNDKDNNPRNDDGQNQQDNQRNQQDEDQRNQQDNEQAKNEDAAIEIKSKVLKEQQQVQIEASLTGVEEPEGDWKLVFNSDDQDNKQEEEEKQTKNQTTFTKTFSISSIKKDTVKVVATFKGKDKKGKIDVTKEEEVNLKDESQKDGDTNEDGTTADEDKVIEKVVQNTQTPPSGQVGGKLPKTATHYGSSLLIGMLLLMSGGIFLLLRRRRTS